jgi:hypothetical protein
VTRAALSCVVAALLAACSTPARAPAPIAAVSSAPESPPPVERLDLDPEASPLPFRWLAGDAVLVQPDAGQRLLASFGNYVGRSARRRARARLSVWDDENAYRRSLEPDADAERALAHKRAQYLKDSEPVPVEEYQVFDSGGEVVYERDFRDWPLTETDP